MTFRKLALLIALGSLVTMNTAQAAHSKKAHTKTHLRVNTQVQKVPSNPGPSAKSHLGTDFDFQGLAIGGKYNTADGILTTVEGDKTLENLLTPRPNYKDRLAVAAESQ